MQDQPKLQLTDQTRSVFNAVVRSFKNITLISADVIIARLPERHLHAMGRSAAAYGIFDLGLTAIVLTRLILKNRQQVSNKKT